MEWSEGKREREKERINIIGRKVSTRLRTWKNEEGQEGEKTFNDIRR